MTKVEILNVFGVPLNTNELAEGGVSLNYSFPDDYRPGSKVSQIAGVSIYVKDERVFGWAPWHRSLAGFPADGSSTAVPLQRSSNAKAESKNHLSFWSISNAPIDGGRLIDTKQLPALGYISAQPALVVKRLKALLEGRQMGFGKNGGQVEFPTVELQFFDEDAAAFERLSTQFRGRQILMMLGETPVIAPYMLSVITNGRVTVLWKQEGYNEIRDTLADLLPPK